MSSHPRPVAGAEVGGRHTSGMARRWRALAAGISAVGSKELRGRMRGRRAFAVLTAYLLLLGLFAVGIYLFLRQQAALQGSVVLALPGEFPVDQVTPFPSGFTYSSNTALSATIGHAVFSGLLLVETLLVLVLAPAFTTGAISMERERGTIDMLVATPLSSLGIVLGKLVSALGYVLLLIVASIPLMALVFVFGGVGPEDVARAYVLLFSLAFGMGALGLFISALVRRTQTATVVTIVVVLALVFGSVAVHRFWAVVGTSAPVADGGVLRVSRSDRAPAALLWLNPFVGDLDLVCTTAPGGYQRESCDYVAQVTGTPYFGSPTGAWACPIGAICDTTTMKEVVDLRVEGRRMALAAGATEPAVVDCPPGADCAGGDDVAPPTEAQAIEFGFPRDTFWPQNAAAFLGLGVVLTLLSSQLVAPTRRVRFLRGGGAPPSTVIEGPVDQDPQGRP